jgi:hypothetical protein
MFSITHLIALSLLFVTCFAASVRTHQPHLTKRQTNASSKAGLGWGNGPNVDINQYRATGKISWCVIISLNHDTFRLICIKRYYTWSPSTGVNTDLEFVPLLWGANQINEWQSTINQTIANRNVKAVLGFNECVLN